MARGRRPCSIGAGLKEHGAHGARAAARGRMGKERGRQARTAVAGGTPHRAGTFGLIPPMALHRLVEAARARIARDLAAEAASGRLILWLPAAFAFGILAYFGAAQEPSLAASLVVVAVLAIAAGVARARPVAFGVIMVLLSAAAGFAAGGARTAIVAHEVVAPPKGPVRLSGFVERVERRPQGDRILLRLDKSAAPGLDPAPELVRLSLRKGWAPPVGTRITQLAQLLPPSGPAMPGAHDFGRAPWFRGIGAIGYGLGRPKAAPAETAPLSVRLAVAIDAVREGLARRIRASLSGIPAEIAVALLAGDRSGIPDAVEESMRTSGLSHVLSISGLHMALVAGTLFALARGLLALAPGLALGWPIKSIAAMMALAGSAFYLMLSGNDVPAQRSFVMTGLVLAGVLAGRPALSLRTVGVAALVVLALTPEAALDPGTQMSFAATLALVAAYERLKPMSALPRPDGIAGAALVWLAVLVGGTALTSLVAGLATAPYGIFHFQRFAPYGLVANLAAMPAVSFLVMPAGLAGVLLMPFGWDHLAWPVMGHGIDLMVAVSDRVAALPGADTRAAFIGNGTLACLSLALLALCLLRGSLTLLALAPLGLAAALAGSPARPDLLVAPDARTVAVRAADGRLSVLGGAGQRLVAEQWLTREGDRRDPKAKNLASAFTCDPLGCVAPLPGGGTVAISRQAEGLAADCLNARIVVTRDPPPRNCPATVLTPEALARTGTIAFHLRDGVLQAEPTRSPAIQRPWMPRLPPLAQDAAAEGDPERDAAQP